MRFIERQGRQTLNYAIADLENTLNYLKECRSCMNDEKTTDTNRYCIFSNASERLARINVAGYAAKLAGLAARIDEALNHLTTIEEK